MRSTRTAAEPSDPARPAIRTRGHVRSFAQGRTCTEPDCETTLSRYNEDTLCWAHAARAEGVRQRP